MATQSRNREQCKHAVQLFIRLDSSGSLGQVMIPPTIKMGLPTSINTLKTIPEVELAVDPNHQTLAIHSFLRVCSVLGPY